jgi:hypothetical protein
MTLKANSALVDKLEGSAAETVPATRRPLLPLPDYRQRDRPSDSTTPVVPLLADDCDPIQHMATPFRYIVVSVGGQTRDEFQVLDTKQGNKPVMMAAAYLTAQTNSRAVAQAYADSLNRMARQIALESERERMAADKDAKLRFAGRAGCIIGMSTGAALAFLSASAQAASPSPSAALVQALRAAIWGGPDAPPAALSAQQRPFDGVWTGRYVCPPPPAGEAAEFEGEATAIIAANHFRMVSNKPAVYEIDEGTVRPDGRLTVSGQGRRRDRVLHWITSFKGTVSETGLRLTGYQKVRTPCVITLSRS